MNHFSAKNRSIVLACVVAGAVGGLVTIGAPGAASQEPTDVGYSVSTKFFPRLDLLNSTMLQVNVTCYASKTVTQAKCSGDAAPSGTVTVKVSAATRKKYKLSSRTFLKAAIMHYGGGGYSFVALLQNKPDRKRLRSIQVASGREVTFKATVTVALTAPLAMTESFPVTLSDRGGRRTTACKSTTPDFPCPSESASGRG